MGDKFSPHLYCTLKGLDVEDDVAEAMRTLGDREACGDGTGYDFLFDDYQGKLEFTCRDSLPVKALEEFSKGRKLELTFVSSANEFFEKGLLFEDGAVTGHRMRQLDGKGFRPPWPEWDRSVPKWPDTPNVARDMGDDAFEDRQADGLEF